MKPCFLVCTPYWTTYEKSKNIQFVRALHIPIFFFNMLFRHVKERLQLLYIFLHIWLWSIGPNHKCKQAIDQSMFCKQMQSCPGKQLFCKRMQIFCERTQSFQENRMCLSESSNIKIVFFFSHPHIFPITISLYGLLRKETPNMTIVSKLTMLRVQTITVFLYQVDQRKQVLQLEEEFMDQCKRVFIQTHPQAFTSTKTYNHIRAR